MHKKYLQCLDMGYYVGTQLTDIYINISLNANKEEIIIWDFYSVKQLWVLMWSWRSG